MVVASPASVWEEEEGGQLGWVGEMVEGDSGATGSIGLKTFREILSEINKVFEFTKALEICARRFRRNFDMGIFPKFF
jgi:hypothetical protein